MKYYLYIPLLIFLISTSCQQGPSENGQKATNGFGPKTSIVYPGESHFKSLKQLTFGGDNAEAYWSFDDRLLVFQSNNRSWDLGCDQIFYFDWQNQDLSTSRPVMVST